MGYIGSAASIQPAETVLYLTKDVVQLQSLFPSFGLVLDDFHHVNHAEIYDSIQIWLEHLPANLQLVISGYTRPPLSPGNLRARGMLTVYLAWFLAGDSFAFAPI